MTKVYLEKDRNRYTVRASGHATGSVETCAAVSTLLYTLAGWLHNDATLILTERLESGEACLEYVGGASAETAFDMVSVGFLQLEKTAPEYIDVDFQNIS